MGKLRKKAKDVLIVLHLFPRARSLYRRLSRQVQAAKRIDHELYSPLIREGDLVFDVGSHLGIKTEIFLEKGARVIAVEPNPLCHPTLQYAFGSNSRFTLLPCALSDTKGRMILNHASVSTAASFREDWPWLKGETIEKIEVGVTTLDCLIERYGIPDFCKIDVEGLELQVLRGLSRPIPIIELEYHLIEAQQFIRCLEYLSRLSEIRINFIAINGSKFELPDWIEVRDLDLTVVPSAGDCFILSDAR